MSRRASMTRTVHSDPRYVSAKERSIAAEKRLAGARNELLKATASGDKFRIVEASFTVTRASEACRKAYADQQETLDTINGEFDAKRS